jgi:hypothetical protein
MKYLATVGLAILLLNRGFGQTANVVGSAAIKDSTAIAVAKKSISSSMSQAVSAIADLKAVGNVTVYGDTGSAKYPVVLKGRGTTRLRYEVQKPKTTDSYVLNGGDSCLTLSGSTKAGVSNNSFGQRVDFIPALSLLSEYAGSDVNVQYAGSALVNGQAADVIALSIVSPPNIDVTRPSQRLYSIDRASGLVTKVQLTEYAENAGDLGVSTEMYFADYRNVSGLMVPFKRTKYVEGRLQSELVLTSVDLAAANSDSDFALTCEVPNAH